MVSAFVAAAFLVGSVWYVFTRPNLAFVDQLAVLGWSLAAMVPVGALCVGLFMVLGALSFWGWGGGEATVLMFIFAPPVAIVRLIPNPPKRCSRADQIRD